LHAASLGLTPPFPAVLVRRIGLDLTIGQATTGEMLPE
jgi:hypothetical protein